MTSKKPSAKAKQRAAFESDWDSLLGGSGARVATSAAFTREQNRIEEQRHYRATQAEFSACGKKNRYATEHDAQETAAYESAKQNIKLEVYKCDYCNGWHITSHPWTD